MIYNILQSPLSNLSFAFIYYLISAVNNKLDMDYYKVDYQRDNKSAAWAMRQQSCPLIPTKNRTLTCHQSRRSVYRA